ncbi:hypothetical protein V5O48_004609 [Marasmius crinis-equi]|uniref:Uncharacterized protein n=1 Tax=Marasmius crinis-equi TaxID=585013 RepID=A0ABR3FPH6_9AGAR
MILHQQYPDRIENMSMGRANRMGIVTVDEPILNNPDCIQSLLTQLQLFIPYDIEYNFIAFFHSALNAVGDQISGIYPTIIVILVNKQRSLRDVTLQSEESEAEAPREREVSALRFRSAGEHSEMDLERGKETQLPRV